MRRVVLGHASGRSVVLSDDKVEPVSVQLLPGAQIHRMWELDEPPTVPVTEVHGPSTTSYFPGPGGLRFGFVTIPPHVSYAMPAGTTEDQLATAIAEAEEKLPGMATMFDPDRPGVHATDTVDFVVVVSGSGGLRTDDDVELRLSAGDCLIQNGTSHVWLNDSDEPFILCYALCGAQ